MGSNPVIINMIDRSFFKDSVQSITKTFRVSILNKWNFSIQFAYPIGVREQ